MSTTGGPRLGGIGRVGNSNLVLALDAHDAKSYPGEPTTNLFPQPSLATPAVGTANSHTNGTWGTTTSTVEKVMGPDGKYIKAISMKHTADGGGTPNIWFFYNQNGMGAAQRNLTLTNGTTYTCSWWWKASGVDSTTGNNIYFTSPNVSTSGTNTVTTEWTKAYVTFTHGGSTGTYDPGHYFYGCVAGFQVWYAMLQIEEKTYGTPAVRSELGFGQQGYNARPVTTNLMIDGKFTPSGGTITTSGDWTTHVFTSSGTFTPGCNSEAEILVVAGGGGGGSHSGGGGGAGGLLYYGSETPKTPNGGAVSVVGGAAYTVTVGAGGAGAVIAPAGSWPPPPGVGGRVGTNGSNSSIIGGYLSLTAIGGGGGGSGAYAVGIAGGCGGGGGRTLAGGAGTTGQGNAGSNGIGSVLAYYSGAGGGGAGATGTTGDNTDGGAGGVGLAYSISGSAVYYAGGGGGNIQGGGGSGGAGGNGGGGAGSQINLYGFNATDNTGGGGGGGAYQANPSTGRYGNGGSGIVIIRYRTFQDSSPGKHTVTPNNIGSGDDPVHSGVSKFSGGSIYFNGYDYWGVKGSYLSVPDSTDWNFGTGDFTVDFWIRLNNLGTSSSGGDYRPHQEIIGNYDSTSGWRIDFTHKGTVEDGIWLYGPGGSVRAGNITGWVVDTWYHIAVVRSSGNVSIYKDGVLRAGPQSWATDVGDSGHPLIIGADPRANPPTGYPLWGYLDEIRVTKGTALWTSNFTPPTRRNLSAPVVDLSGNHQGGNFATKEMTDVATYRDGQVIEPVASAVWDFDNTDDVITLGPSSGFGITNAVSVYAWVKLDTLSGWNGVFGTTSGGSFIHFQMLSGGLNVYVYGPAAGYDRLDSECYVSAGEWAYVGFTFGSNTLTVYRDGEPMPTTVAGSSASVNSTTEVSVGRVYNSGRMFNGQIGNVQVYTTTLTAQQVKQNFNSQRSRFKV